MAVLAVALLRRGNARAMRSDGRVLTQDW